MSNPPEYLVDQIDIIAHLFFASGTADRVIVTSNGRVFDGAYRFPDGEGGFIACGAGMPWLEPGSTVQVEYVGPTDEYRFEATVLAQQATGFHVSLPRTIERSDRRATPRILLSPDAGVHFVEEGGRAYVACDLSDGGAGLVDLTNEPRAEGQVLRGRLMVPGIGPLETTLEIRNVRSTDDSRRLSTRFLEMSYESRGELGRVLRMWQRELGA